MAGIAAKPGFTAGVVGTAFLIPLIIVRVVASADVNHVWFFGHEPHWGCWFKQHFGVPCPACGMTRSVILTLHGHFQEASQLNAAGLLGVIGLLLFIGAMFFLMVRQQSSANASLKSLERQIRIWTFVYGGLVIAVSSIQWILKVSGYV